MPSALLITSESWDQLEDEWIGLYACVPAATPFQHPAFVAAWLRHFQPSSGPVFLGLRDSERLVGVATLEPGPRSARQLGDANVCDYSGPLALPEFENAVSEGIVEWLLEDLTEGVEFWGIPAGSPMREPLLGAAAHFGWQGTETLEAIAPALDLPSSFEEYVAALGKHDRHELRRKLRNLHAAGEVRFESATDPETIRAGMDQFLSLMRISRDDKDAFLTPRMEQFFRDLAPSMASAGLARLSSLVLDGVVVAMLFGFEDRNTAYLYNSGFDPTYSHLAVGLLSKACAIEAAIGRGESRFDFLRGEEDYKRHLGGVPEQIYTLQLGRR